MTRVLETVENKKLDFDYSEKILLFLHYQIIFEVIGIFKEDLLFPEEYLLFLVLIIFIMNLYKQNWRGLKWINCIWVSLKNVRPLFFKFVVCHVKSFTQLEYHSRLLCGLDFANEGLFVCQFDV